MWNGRCWHWTVEMLPACQTYCYSWTMIKTHSNCVIGIAKPIIFWKIATKFVIKNRGWILRTTLPMLVCHKHPSIPSLPLENYLAVFPDGSQTPRVIEQQQQQQQQQQQDTIFDLVACTEIVFTSR